MNKDQEQDRIIHENSERIARNEAAILRQTEALEKIRDHYYPPPKKAWMRACTLLAKIACAVFAYLGVAQTVDWLWNARESDALAKEYSRVAWRLLLEQGDASGAISCCEKAIEVDPKDANYVMDLTFMKGMALATDLLDNGRLPTDAEHERIDAMLTEAQVLAELEPDDAMPQVLMAQAYLLSGENAEAMAAMDRALARAPENGYVQVFACSICYYAEQRQLAREHLSLAERYNPELAQVPLWKGTLALMYDHDAAEAVKLLRETVRRSPRLAVGHEMLGRAIMAEAKPDLAAARVAFKQSIVLDARQATAPTAMAGTYEQEGNLPLARLWLDRALAVRANYLPALVDRARVCGRLGDLSACLTDLTAAIALAPFRADLYQLRAAAYDKTGDAVHAKADRQSAEALKKDQQ